MAGAVIAMLPVLIVYILAQRRFIEGLAMTGLTGR
jgi:multiple sugar transport system permease protein